MLHHATDSEGRKLVPREIHVMIWCRHADAQNPQCKKDKITATAMIGVHCNDDGTSSYLISEKVHADVVQAVHNAAHGQPEGVLRRRDIALPPVLQIREALLPNIGLRPGHICPLRVWHNC